MQLIFGLRLDDNFLPYAPLHHKGLSHLGPHGLLEFLEKHLGLTGHVNNMEYLRIEQYRQACLTHLNAAAEQGKKAPFYKNAVSADAFAVAADLLSRRDELLLAGWNFETDENTPERLQTLAELEQHCAEKGLSPGYADRFIAIEKALKDRKQPIRSILLNEPIDILPRHLVRLFKKMVGAEHIEQIPCDLSKGETDLAKFQKALTSQTKKMSLDGDGSLLILRAKRANEAAVTLAKILKNNNNYRPALIVPERNRTLDTALIKEGLPSLGIPSASLARPSLQILKLVTAFLWDPIDPYKILEFVSLAVKPLHRELGNIIGRLMANTPGINGDDWFRELSIFFNQLEEKAKKDKTINIKDERGWYNFWFARTRYAADSTVPKGEVIEIFKRLQDWAYKIYEDSNGKSKSMSVLSGQSRRIKELLQELPETQLSNLELERIVRTIYEPSPVVFKETELTHLEYSPNPSAVIGDIDDLIWWNFTQNEPVHFFSRWYVKERNYLQSTNVQLTTPKEENARLLWQRSRPVLRTQSRLLLCIPEMINGTEVQEHPLFDNFKAAFDNPEAITYNLHTETGRDFFESFFNIENQIEIKPRKLGRPNKFLKINNLHRLEELDKKRDYETYSSINSLFYYPYQWIFRYKIKLQSSSILSVVNDKTLMGNLAHKMFEKMLEEDFSLWKKEDVHLFTEKTINNLLKREGAVLLMYGRAPERLNFINKLKIAAWSLIRHLQDNNWKVEATEMNLSGDFASTNIKGITDLVLKRDDETAIVDLKWSGRSYRENLIRSEEDLQLVLYTKLLEREAVHTSFFIMSDAKMIARNNKAFEDVEALLPDADHAEVHERMLTKMQATYGWRLKQIADNLIEVRTKATAGDLEDYYEEQDSSELLLSLLEMKDTDAPFDDYGTLVGVED